MIILYIILVWLSLSCLFFLFMYSSGKKTEQDIFEDDEAQMEYLKEWRKNHPGRI